MDAIEKAIRNAFEKGNADDRAFREKVYRSAFAALDRALMANPGVTVEAAIKRRKAMQAKIAEIESEFLPAVGPSPEASADDAPAVEPAGGGSGAMPPRERTAQMPTLDGERESARADAPASGVLPVVPDIMPDRTPPGPAPDEIAEVAPDRDARRIHGRRLPLTAIFFGVTLLAAIGIGLWWATQTGAFKTLEELGQPPSPTPTVEGDDYSPDQNASAPLRPGEADQDRNWINVFSPDDPAAVTAPSDAKAQVMKDDTGSFLRIQSGASGSAVSFDVGQGVLEQLVGKHAIFDIIARAEDGKDTQMSVDCNFGELGDCGRKRYAVGHERNEYLFEVEFPKKQPGAAGTIAVNSDFDKQGKSVDIYSIRVSVQQ
ncbi:hypothetical protein [Mesorhizobium sp. SP-1A]|uniref:hypothetical protein n=1 Tax=Mesorhizobium sp. SP-1A TaxID=3077840 RepID=UPI0028F72BE7|nr:hypothetical protein [Mesorhizobium sp. SP-1A]